MFERLLVLALVGAILLYYAMRGWTSWRDLWVIWGAWFLGVVVLSAVRDTLLWGLVSGTAAGLLFALGLRQLPRRIPLPKERIKSLPPGHHSVIEVGQLLFAALGVVFTAVFSAPLLIGFSLTFLACALVGLEALSRLRSRRFWELEERIGEIEDPGDGT